MSTKLEFQTVIDFVLAEISDQADFIYLMGSFGTDRFNDQSDLDFAVFWKKNPEFSELIKIKSKFEDHFQRDVELVSLNKIDIIFAAQVLETGRLVYLNESFYLTRSYLTSYLIGFDMYSGYLPIKPSTP